MTCKKHQVTGYCARCADRARKAREREDALRYRWLRAQPQTGWYIHGLVTPNAYFEVLNDSGEHLDHEIDLARSR